MAIFGFLLLLIEKVVRRYSVQQAQSKDLHLWILEDRNWMRYYFGLVIEAERTLVLVRHGQTEWNVEERFQGQLDIPMNAVGCRQAADVKAYLAGTTFDQVYTSPLRRAFETARLIVEGSAVTPDWRLSEIHHGSWQGRTKNEIRRQWPDQWKRWREQSQFTPRNGEPAGRVRLRVEEFFQSMQGTNVLCVSHGVIIQNFLSLLLGSSYSAQVPCNCSIHLFYFRKSEVCQYHEVNLGSRVNESKRLLFNPLLVRRGGRAADGVVARAEDFGVSDHPVCGASRASPKFS